MKIEIVSYAMDLGLLFIQNFDHSPVQLIERNLQTNLYFGLNVRSSLYWSPFINILCLEVILMLRFTIIQ